jgi:hypothetical protein
MSKRFRVIWEIDVWADSPREAAERAREIQLDQTSAATVFKIAEKRSECFEFSGVVDLQG